MNMLHLPASLSKYLGNDACYTVSQTLASILVSELQIDSKTIHLVLLSKASLTVKNICNLTECRVDIIFQLVTY